MLLEHFGVLPDGREVQRIVLKNEVLELELLTYGGAIRRLVVPSRTGQLDVVCGYDDLDSYLQQTKFMGTLLGRYANRIGGASFPLGGKTVRLTPGLDGHQLHGGPTGFSQQLWIIQALGSDMVTLALHSPDGHEGYPGAMDARVTYRLRDRAMEIFYWAKADADTVCNLSNHSYYNLSGHDRGSIDELRIRILADRYVPTGPDLIPTGELADLTGTPLDLREPTTLGERLDSSFRPMADAHGFDHCYVLNGPAGTLHPAAQVWSPDSGIRLEVRTDQPGLQFYTGNFLGGGPVGKGGAIYGNHSAFCLETQCFPDTPNHPGFPGGFLKAGQEYQHTAIFDFDVV